MSEDAQNYITSQWRELRRDIANGLSPDYKIAQIEKRLSAFKEKAEYLNGKRNENGEIFDVDIAYRTHDFYKSWMPFVKEQRVENITYWRSEVSRFKEFGEKISLAAFSTLTLLHGGVAVGALNIISQKTPVQAAAILAAKIAIPLAMMGIFLLGLGYLLVFHFGFAAFSRIDGRISSTPKYISLMAFHKYLQKYNKIFKLGNSLFYASFFWFVAYCVILYIILIT